MHPWVQNPLRLALWRATPCSSRYSQLFSSVSIKRKWNLFPHLHRLSLSFSVLLSICFFSSPLLFSSHSFVSAAIKPYLSTSERNCKSLTFSVMWWLGLRQPCGGWDSSFGDTATLFDIAYRRLGRRLPLHAEQACRVLPSSRWSVLKQKEMSYSLIFHFGD